MVPVKSPFASRVLLVGVVTLGLFLVSGLAARWSAAPARAAALPVQSPTVAAAPAITVTGTGTIDVTPDVARIVVSVQTTAPTATQAEADNATAADRVRANVVRAGVTATDIKTLSLQVWPRYDYRTGQSVLNGFEASHSLQFTVHNLARIGAVIDAAVAGGATTVQGITYDTNDHTTAGAQALARAVKDAQVKARAIGGCRRHPAWLGGVDHRPPELALPVSNPAGRGRPEREQFNRGVTARHPAHRERDGRLDDRLSPVEAARSWNRASVGRPLPGRGAGSCSRSV